MLVVGDLLVVDPQPAWTEDGKDGPAHDHAFDLVRVVSACQKAKKILNKGGNGGVSYTIKKGISFVEVEYLERVEGKSLWFQDKGAGGPWSDWTTKLPIEAFPRVHVQVENTDDDNGTLSISAATEERILMQNRSR